MTRRIEGEAMRSLRATLGRERRSRRKEGRSRRVSECRKSQAILSFLPSSHHEEAASSSSGLRRPNLRPRPLPTPPRPNSSSSRSRRGRSQGLFVAVVVVTLTLRALLPYLWRTNRHAIPRRPWWRWRLRLGGLRCWWSRRRSRCRASRTTASSSGSSRSRGGSNGRPSGRRCP